MSEAPLPELVASEPLLSSTVTAEDFTDVNGTDITVTGSGSTYTVTDRRPHRTASQ